MPEDVLLRIILAIIIGTLAAIVYSLRVVVVIERRIARIEKHLDNLTHKILKEELKIEKGLKKR